MMFDWTGGDTMRVRRTVALLLAVMLAGLFVCAQAAGKMIGSIKVDGITRSIYKDGDWWYYFTDEGVTIYQYNGKSMNVVIPGELDGRPVNGITTWAVPANAVSVTFPGSFTSLPDRVCYQRGKLTRVVLQEGVTSVGASAFWNCTALTEISFPSTLRQIGVGAFYASAVTELNLSGFAGLSIGNHAFRGCPALRSAALGSGVVSLGDGVFSGCGALTEVRLGASVTAIGAEAFADTGLTGISLPAALKSLGMNSLNTPGLTTVDIPDSVTALGLPLVDENSVMIVGENSPAHRIILAEKALNFRLRGQPYVPGQSEAVTIGEKIQEVLHQAIRPGMDTYAKALALHDWLTANAQYDPTRSQPNTYEPAGVLLRGAGVCQSYAKAYSLLLDAVGIPNTLEYGTDHVWNLVCFDGEWLHVDVTWNDPLSASQNGRLESVTKSGRETHTYFGLTNEAFYSVEHHECFNQPHVATGYLNSHAYRTGALTRHINAITSQIQTQLNAGKRSFSFKPSTFTASGLSSAAAINERLSVAAARAQTYTAGGKPMIVTIDFNCTTRMMTVTAVPALSPVDLGGLTVAPGDALDLLQVETVWTSSDPAVAAVTAGGSVRALKAGTAVLTGLSGGSEYTFTLTVTAMTGLAINAPFLGEESFSGLPAGRVDFSADVARIGADSFCGMPGLRIARFEGQTEIEDGCFVDCPQLTVLAPADSPAAHYAERNGIPWYPLP